RTIIVFIICFTILLLTGIAFYFYNTLQQTAKNETFHLSEIETAENFTEMIEKADVIVIGQYEGLNSTVNLIREEDRKSTRLNSSHVSISYAVFCLKKKIKY